MKELLKAKSEFRKKGVVLVADKIKTGAGGTWKFAGEDNFIKTIQKPLLESDLEVIVIMDGDNVKATLYHIASGENLTSSIKLPPVAPKLDSRGNPLYLDAEIERGKQFGYWSRVLSMRLLGISDIDPEDINNRPEDMTDEAAELRRELDDLIGKSKNIDGTKDWICSTYKVSNVNELFVDNIKHVINTLKQKANK